MNNIFITYLWKSLDGYWYFTDRFSRFYTEKLNWELIASKRYSIIDNKLYEIKDTK